MGALKDSIFSLGILPDFGRKTQNFNIILCLTAMYLYKLFGEESKDAIEKFPIRNFFLINSDYFLFSERAHVIYLLHTQFIIKFVI